MTGLEMPALVLLAAWGILAGVDLASWPQLLLARPLVAGGVAGLLLGDPVAGLGVGATLELFALEVLPIGATRYPDFSPAAVAGVVVAAGRPLPLTLGLGAGVGLVLAQLSRVLVDQVRRRNAIAVQRAEAGLAAGAIGVVRRLHWQGLLRDAVRAAVLTVVGIGAALLVRSLGLPSASLGSALSLTAIAGGAAAALAGAVRTASQGGRLGWLIGGGLLGILLMVFR